VVGKIFLAMLKKSWYLERCSRRTGSGRLSGWAQSCKSFAADPGHVLNMPFRPGDQTLNKR